jgi:hypothetical protein
VAKEEGSSDCWKGEDASDVPGVYYTPIVSLMDRPEWRNEDRWYTADIEETDNERTDSAETNYFQPSN